MSRGKHWTKEEEDFLRKNYPDQPNEVIFEHLNRTPAAIQQHVVKLRLRKRKAFYANGLVQERETDPEILAANRKKKEEKKREAARQRALQRAAAKRRETLKKKKKAQKRKAFLESPRGKLLMENMALREEAKALGVKVPVKINEPYTRKRFKMLLKIARDYQNQEGGD